MLLGPVTAKSQGFLLGRRAAEFSLYICDLVVDWLLDLCNHGVTGNGACLNLEGATL